MQRFERSFRGIRFALHEAFGKGENKNVSRGISDGPMGREADGWLKITLDNDVFFPFIHVDRREFVARP